MPVSCPKCGHTNHAASGDPTDACPACGLIYAKYDAASALRDRLAHARRSGDWSGIDRSLIPDALRPIAAASIPATTTPLLPGRAIASVIDVVSAECAYGMNIFKDLLTSITDVTGGQSTATQSTLRDARRTVMAQLRAEAFALGADAVVGVHLDYSEFSGGGKSMLFVVATGTAVRLSPAV